jgi:hypothetical protein
VINRKRRGYQPGKKSVFSAVVFLHILLLLIVFAANGFFLTKSEDIKQVEEHKEDVKSAEVSAAEAENVNKEEVKEGKSYTFVQSLCNQGARKAEVKTDGSLNDELVAIKANIPKAEKQLYQDDDNADLVKTEEYTDKKDSLVEKEDQEAVDEVEETISVTDETEVVKESEHHRDNELDNKAPEEKTAEFNYEEYEQDLIAQYGIDDGEKVPVLLFDNYRQTYKEGLAFYGFNVLVARPLTPFVDDQFYYVVTASGIDLIQEEFPYNGVFPQALPEDERIFKSLLSTSDLSSETYEGGYQIFYSPSLKTGAHMPLLCKQKKILDSIGMTSEDVANMTGSFTKVGESYIIIIKSVETYDGKNIIVNDPDNISLLVRR